MVTGHNFSVWRTPPDQGFTLWARCKCGLELFARSYEDLAILTAEHYEDVLTTRDLEEQERAHS